MIESLPWPAQVGVAGLGWFVAFLFLYGLITGRWIVTRREADLAQKRVDAQDKIISEQAQQIGLLLNSAVPTVDAVLRALRDAADLGDRTP